MITVGSSTVVELPSKFGYDPRLGDYKIRVFRGTEADIATLKAEFRLQGVKVETESDPDRHWWTLNATIGNDGDTDPLADSWELDGNDLDKSIWELPEIVEVTHAPIDVTSPTAVEKATWWREFRAAVTAFVEGRRTIETDNGETVDLNMDRLISSGLLLGLDQAAVIVLVLSLLQGVEVFPVSQWVLKRRTIVGRGARIKPSKSNVNRIFTVEQLRTMEGLPESLPFDIPAGVWAKKTPKFPQIAADKWAIDQEYWHADSANPLIWKPAESL